MRPGAYDGAERDFNRDGPEEWMMVRPAEARKARAEKHLARLRLLLALKDEILRTRLASVQATAPGEAPERVISAIVLDAWDERKVIEEVEAAWATSEGNVVEDAPRSPSIEFEEHVRALIDLKREGVRAYRQAALDCPDATLRRSLFKLARREEEHVHVLTNLIEVDMKQMKVTAEAGETAE